MKASLQLRLVAGVAFAVAAVFVEHEVYASPLFESAVSNWKIAVPPECPRPVAYAVEELTNVLARISGGASFSVVSANCAAKQDVVSIRLVQDGNIDDVFSVDAQPEKVVLSGNSPRAVLFAVYAFLRDCLGARWYWPGPSGEFLPRIDRFDVAPFKKTYRPAFRYREMSICGALPKHRHPTTEKWFPKVFLNCGLNTPELRLELGLVDVVSSHCIGLPYYMSERKKVFEKHQEWFSLVNGERRVENYAGCWSNPEFTSWLVDRLDAMLANRRPDLASLFVADLRPRCECADCTADPDVSARFWSYYAKLRGVLKKRRPSQVFAGLAYMEYMPPPKIKVDGLEYVEYAHYDRCWYHLLEDPKCAKNASSLDVIRQWGKKATLGIYGYEFDVYNQLLYLPIGKFIEETMRVYRKMGIMRVKTEYGVDLYRLDRKNPFPKARIGQLVNRLSYYTWAMCALNPDSCFADILDDFCRHVYGAAAEPMRAYHSLMADAWITMPIHTRWNYNNFPLGPSVRFLTPERQKRAENLLKEAEAAVRSDSRAAGEVAIDKEAFLAWARLVEDARSGNTTYEMPELYGKDVFATLSAQRFRPLRHPSQETRIKLYRDRTAMFLQIDCNEKNPSFDKGLTGHDKMDWKLQSIELFIDTGDGAKRQLAFSPAGGVWDAKDGDVSWDSGAKVKTDFFAKSWRMRITLPFSGLGGRPANGSKWKFMAIRNADKKSGLSTCGWPVAVHGDFKMAATLEFSNE